MPATAETKSATPLSASAPSQLTVLLVNSGTPDSLSWGGVWSFLRSLLSDPRLIELPRWLWLPILHLIILPIRSGRVAKLYRAIWQPEGSPLAVISESLALKLEQRLASQLPAEVTVQTAMLHSSPRLRKVLQAVPADNTEHLLLIPMFPQYTGSVTGGVYDTVASYCAANRNLPTLTIVKDYHIHPLYIEGLRQQLENYWQQHGRAEKLLLSFHSLPNAYVRKGDPYHRQCLATTEALVAALGLQPDEWALSFQSRFLGGRWLSPYTSVVLEQWGSEAVSSVQVFCPGFSVDCLETVSEIDIEYREIFTAAGGGDFQYIPCLNDTEQQLALLTALAQQSLNKA